VPVTSSHSRSILAKLSALVFVFVTTHWIPALFLYLVSSLKRENPLNLSPFLSTVICLSTGHLPIDLQNLRRREGGGGEGRRR
jgi:tellurite resistance protein TehA-like permease